MVFRCSYYRCSIVPMTQFFARTSERAKSGFFEAFQTATKEIWNRDVDEERKPIGQVSLSCLSYIILLLNADEVPLDNPAKQSQSS